MHFVDFERLRPIGLTAEVLQQAALPPTETAAGRQAPHDPGRNASAPHPPNLLRVSAVHRSEAGLHDGIETRRATLAPSLARLLDEGDEVLTVGDWVLATAAGNDEWLIVQRLAPLNLIARRDAHGRRHPLVSNVDAALLTMGLDADFSLRRIERFVSLVHHCGVRPVIVLTKADLVSNAQTLYARQRIVRERLGSELALLCVDARDADTALRLQPFVGPGQTLVVLGSSGAGKSTLVNTLLGAPVQDTGGVRRHDNRGRHTTRSRTLFLLPQGGCIIDTPGLRALRADADEQAVAASFGEIHALAAECRFRNCRHLDEPGCRVREIIDSDRLANYHKLLREARRDTTGPLEQRHQLAVWKARSRAQRARQRAEDRSR